VGEKQNVEWKSDWKDEYLAWICGFANAQGGVLMIGVDDSGKPVGLRGARKLLTDLPNKIRNALGVVVDVNLREGPPEYIEIDVPRYPVPISSKGVYYIRSGSTNQRLSGVDLESFIMRRRGVSWDTLPVPRADIMIKFTAPEDRIIRTDGRLTDDHATEKTTRNVIKRITKAAVWEQAIIELILENPNYTTAELASELSVSRQMVSRRIKTLKDKGIIVRRGSPTKGYWEIASDE